MKERLVIKPSIAKTLLRMGFSIIDLKPFRNMDGTFDYTKCIFIFKEEEGLDEIIKRLK